MRFRLPHVMLLLIGLLLMNTVAADNSGPIIPKGKGEQCVADTDFMRRNHMDLIVHQRDETVIRGIRDEPFSLAECVDCHVQTDANAKPIRIDAEGQFCSSCHTYVAAKIDCFGCHAAVPDPIDDKKLGFAPAANEAIEAYLARNLAENNSVGDRSSVESNRLAAKNPPDLAQTHDALRTFRQKHVQAAHSARTPLHRESVLR